MIVSNIEIRGNTYNAKLPFAGAFINIQPARRDVSASDYRRGHSTRPLHAHYTGKISR